MKKSLLIALGAIFVLGSWLVGSYNTLVNLDEDANREYANVETVLQRRFDLIDNLVATVKGAADFEKDTFTGVAEARTAWANAKTPQEKFKASSLMDSALSRLMVSVEQYPELKATENFRDLQIQLEGSENRIAVARKRYNDSATTINKAMRRFPVNILANIFGFNRHDLFESTEGADIAPKVEF